VATESQREITVALRPLERFFYCSALAPQHQATYVGAILKTARAFNATHGITGILLFDGARFVQCIEGDGDILNPLIGRILGDERHCAIQILLCEPLGQDEERRYPGWSMGYCDVESEDLIASVAALPGAQGLEMLRLRHHNLDLG